MAENERDFKGVWIPKSIWLDTRLNALEKVILIEIDSLDNSEKGCFKSNKSLAEFCQCSETKISMAISKLTELGYIYTQSFNGRQRELKSRLSNTDTLPFKICKADFQKVKESNTNSNTLSNDIIYIVDYLNQKANKSFKANSDKTQSLLKGLLTRQGFTVNDCISVIDKKCASWLNTEFEQYLRPITLFGNKFESYLNEPIAVKKASANKGNSFDTTMRELAEFVGEDTEFDFEDTDEYRDIMGDDDNA